MSRIQSVIFNKKRWSITDARKWLKDNNYIHNSKVDTTNMYHRFRQVNPSSKYKKRTLDFGKGIKAIVEYTSS